MKALVIYDSAFGNTAQIAQTIGKALGEALGAPAAVTVRQVGDVTADDLTEVSWLLVGSPTQGFRPTKAMTAYLKSLPRLDGVQVAAFDTRIALETIKPSILRFMVDRGGYAAKPIATHLQRSGGRLAAAPEGFIVEGREGPLKAGEISRAAEWAKRLVAVKAAAA